MQVDVDIKFNAMLELKKPVGMKNRDRIYL